MAKTKGKKIKILKRQQSQKERTNKITKKTKKQTPPPVKAKRLPLEEVVDLSFASFSEGMNGYFEQSSESAEDFLKEKGVGYNFSSGMRAYISPEGLKVNPPVTWIPKVENPTVADYVRELYNPDIKEMQLNAFNFILTPDGEDEDFIPLACCVISSTRDPKEEGSAYLVLREFKLNSETKGIDIEKKYFEGEDYISELEILELPLEPM